jgi:hypothetical protein
MRAPMYFTWTFSEYEDDLSDYSERPELTKLDSQKPAKPEAAPLPQFRPAPTLSSTAEQSEEEEDENLLLPEVTEANDADQPTDLFSFPQNLDGFADTFMKFSPDRPESIGNIFNL